MKGRFHASIYYKETCCYAISYACGERKFTKLVVHRTISFCLWLYQEWRSPLYCYSTYQKLCRLFLHYTEKKCLACGSQMNDIWAISGLLCGYVGQIGQQMCYTFNPVPYFESYQVYLCTCQNITMSDSLQNFLPINFLCCTVVNKYKQWLLISMYVFGLHITMIRCQGCPNSGGQRPPLR